MAYDENLAARIRAYVQDDLDVTEKKMFGGLAFLASGNMAVAAVSAGGLMLRCDPEEADRLVAEDGASRMVMKGREMQNWLVVDERTSGSLQFCATLAPPESKADIDPTAANADEHARWYAAWSAAVSDRLSRVSSSSLRPQMSLLALK